MIRKSLCSLATLVFIGAALPWGGHLFSSSSVELFVAEAFVPPIILPSLQRKPQSLSSLLFYQNNDAKSSADWRDVRARLIRQFRQEEQKERASPSSSASNATTIAASTSSIRTTKSTSTTLKNEGDSLLSPCWAYDSDGLIEKGSLMVSHPVQDFSCGGLRQHSFTKSVLLIVKETPSFRKGIILNRQGISVNITDPSSNHIWTMYYGGEVQGMDAAESAADFTCLHRLSTSMAKELSYPIVKDLQHTTWDMAQLLVKRGEATPQDFVTFVGYAGWAPNKLESELQRGNWFMVATDDQSLSDLVFAGRNNSQPDGEQASTGMDTWTTLMHRIGKADLVQKYATKQNFENAVLNQWVQDRRNFLKAGQEGHTDDIVDEAELTRKKNGLIIQPHSSSQKDASSSSHPIVQEGTIYRAQHPIVLKEQFFHESLVLILKTDERGNMGVILNRPSSRIIDLGGKAHKEKGKATSSVVPVRYGGRYGLYDENAGSDEQRSKQTAADHTPAPETWLHFGHAGLREAQVGVPIVPEDDAYIWQCSRQDAETAVEMGLASPSDFLVTLGFTLWERKAQSSASQQSRPLTMTRLEKEFQPVAKASIPNLWKELLQQTCLSMETLDRNLEKGKAAYKMAKILPPQQAPTPKHEKESTTNYLKEASQRQKNKNSTVGTATSTNDLADEALRRWMVMFLLNATEADR